MTFAANRSGRRIISPWPTRSGFYVNLIPVFSALMAVFFLSESLYAFHALSVVMVLGGIYLAERHRAAS